MKFQSKTRMTVGFVSVVSLLAACSDDDMNGPEIEMDAGYDGGTTTDTTDTTDTTSAITTTDTTGLIGTTDTTDTIDNTDTTDTIDTTDSIDTDGGIPDGGGTDTVGPDAAWDGATPDSGPDASDGDVPDGGDMDASDGSYAEVVVPGSEIIENAQVPEGFQAWEWADDLAEPRGITVDGSGNVLIVEQDEGRVVALWDDDGDGASGSDERAVVATAAGLNHGISINGGFLYASSATTVYRWAYTAERTDLGDGVEVITDIPGGGNHVTRTLVFDDAYLYISVGSAANVDPTSERAQVRRFPIADLDTSTEFYDGELYADGLRNEVGLAIDLEGKVWGVENGMDNLFDDDLGGDIHNDNPGEELNLFTTPGAFYGYPYCWSEYQLEADAGMGPGAQWALESDALADAGAIDDEWCQDPENVVPPALVFPAHVAPLGIVFYDGGNFPSEYVGDALVTFHGSWNAEPPVGYKVVRVPFGTDGMPEGGWETLYEFSGSGDTGDAWNERPVDLVVLPNGTVLVTSDDNADRVFAIAYTGG